MVEGHRLYVNRCRRLIFGNTASFWTPTVPTCYFDGMPNTREKANIEKAREALEDARHYLVAHGVEHDDPTYHLVKQALDAVWKMEDAADKAEFEMYMRSAMALSN